MIVCGVGDCSAKNANGFRRNLLKKDDRKIAAPYDEKIQKNTLYWVRLEIVKFL